MVKLHIALGEAELEGLAALAEAAGQPRSRLIRQAVGAYLAKQRRQSLQTAMREYAERFAEHSGEFVAETSEHVTARLLRETQW